MSQANYLKRVAIVGASGGLGTYTLNSLLQANRFDITVLSRASSDATFPSSPSLTVKKVDYDSEAALTSALKGHDAVVIILAFTSPPETQTRIIDAAAKAGVPWIVPCEFGSDGTNEALLAAVPILAHKKKYRDQIEALDGLSWIGIATNPWFDYSLAGGYLGFDSKARTAEIYDGGNTKINLTNMATAGLAISRVLSLPVTSVNGEPALSDYKNKFCYVRSFFVTQSEIFEALQQATGTTESDWKVTHTTSDARIANGERLMSEGNFMGMVDLLYGNTFKDGVGNEFESNRPIANKALGLPEEGLVESARKALAKAVA